MQPDIIFLDPNKFSTNHCEHWIFLSKNPEQTMQWIHTALDEPVMPMGLCPNETEMNPSYWFIQGPTSSPDIRCSQVHSIKDDKPQQLKHAFPTFSSPYAYQATIKQILASPDHSQAILCLELENQTITYAFDVLYSVNQNFYQKNQKYNVSFTAWAYQLEAITTNETVTIDDPEAIRHHRALNDILSQHEGKTPSNLQDLIQAWQPSSEEDKQPINIDISKTTAYLYGDKIGQEDEAWFQGQIVGKTSTVFMNETYSLYDIVFILEENSQKNIVRIATKNPEYQNFNIGQYIRGDIWLQAHIFETHSP